MVHFRAVQFEGQRPNNPHVDGALSNQRKMIRQSFAPLWRPSKGLQEMPHVRPIPLQSPYAHDFYKHGFPFRCHSIIQSSNWSGFPYHSNKPHKSLPEVNHIIVIGSIRCTVPHDGCLPPTPQAPHLAQITKAANMKEEPRENDHSNMCIDNHLTYQGDRRHATMSTNALQHSMICISPSCHASDAICFTIRKYNEHPHPDL